MFMLLSDVAPGLIPPSAVVQPVRSVPGTTPHLRVLCTFMSNALCFSINLTTSNHSSSRSLIHAHVQNLCYDRLNQDRTSTKSSSCGFNTFLQSHAFPKSSNCLATALANLPALVQSLSAKLHSTFTLSQQDFADLQKLSYSSCCAELRVLSIQRECLLTCFASSLPPLQLFS